LSGHASLVRLGANESAFGPSPRALAAMQRELAHAAWYGDPESLELREALARRLGIAADTLVVGAGIDDLEGLLVRAYLAPGALCIAALGTYPTFAYHVAGYGARLDGIPYESDGALPLEALAALASERGAAAIYLANPDNPSGSFVPRAQLERLLAYVPAPMLVVLDEAYLEFAPPEEILPAGYDDPRLVRLRTFSKAYGLAGLRIGFAFGNAAHASALNAIRTQFGVNRIAQAGALAALADDAYLAEAIAENARGRDAYRALARELGLSTLASHTNFVCFDLGSRMRAEALVEALLRRGVFVRKPGLAPLDRCVRVTVGNGAERAAFAAALRGALAELGAAEEPRPAVPVTGGAKERRPPCATPSSPTSTATSKR
ncbi:MAG: aminotransferase class I/II-fold pyridoxal phosphate-dependent enzyme, partial [Vulcanimicrobiaceae bacterium]